MQRVVHSIRVDLEAERTRCKGLEQQLQEMGSREQTARWGQAGEQSSGAKGLEQQLQELGQNEDS